MAHMTITINLDNFGDREDEACEAAVVLHDLASSCRAGMDLNLVNARRLQDSDGNQIGEVRVIRDQEKN